MPEFRYARGRIEESLQFLTEEIKEFNLEYADKTLHAYQEDKKLQKLIQLILEREKKKR